VRCRRQRGSTRPGRDGTTRGLALRCGAWPRGSMCRGQPWPTLSICWHTSCCCPRTSQTAVTKSAPPPPGRTASGPPRLAPPLSASAPSLPSLVRLTGLLVYIDSVVLCFTSIEKPRKGLRGKLTQLWRAKSVNFWRCRKHNTNLLNGLCIASLICKIYSCMLKLQSCLVAWFFGGAKHTGKR
jgi:hypothetical protein